MIQPRPARPLVAAGSLVLLARALGVAAAAAAPADASGAAAPAAEVAAAELVLQIDRPGRSRLVARLHGVDLPLGPYRDSDYVVVAGQPQRDFPLAGTRQEAVADAIGRGTSHLVLGESPRLRREIAATTYPDFPGFIVLQTRYTVLGPTALRLDRWVARRFLPRAPGPGAPAFWSYQGASYSSRPDWVLPLPPGFSRQNSLGMNASDYGGGTPVLDVWRRDLGLAVGHLEKTPRLVSLPVARRGSSGVDLGVEGEVGRVLQPGETFLTPRTFVAVHRGDHFASLAAYRRLMERQGVRFPAYGPDLYEPIWCAWGYGRGFLPAQVVQTLPTVAAQGWKWAVIDDGWQTAEGDWYLDPRKFPGGDRDMRALTDQIRAAGLRPILWWAPLAVDPGTDLHREHPDFLLLDRAGKPQKITWWDSYYLCPAYEPVRAYTRALVQKMLGPWGHDGLKLDGQHLNGAPPCYNPRHGHATPAESSEKLPELFQLIHDTARALKPDALVELCPCGTGYAFHSMPFMNVPAASDPESSWQIRSKGKTLKALMGPRVPYYGDHVELSDQGRDFASTVGVGGVVGSQFTLPGAGPSPRKYQLTPEKEALWKKWVALYRDKMLSRGDYLGDLYDIGFDRPEAHAVKKDGRLYYAFFARRFTGRVELRGLEPRPYCVRDYVENHPFPPVQGPTAPLEVDFTHHLLLEATPQDPAHPCN